MHKYILRVVVFVLLVISGCTDNPASHIVLPTSNTEDIAANDSFFLLFKPVGTMPELTVAFTQISGPIYDEFNPIYTYICTLKQADAELQSFEVESTEVLCPAYVDFLDIDFDGFLDMSVVWFAGNANRTYNFYRYDIWHNVFEETSFFSTGGTGIVSYTDTKQIIVTVHDQAVCYAREMYQYSDGEYTLLRWESADVIDFEPLTYSLHIWQNSEGDFTEIFTSTLTEDEYYGDLTVRDNYLRFGTESAP